MDAAWADLGELEVSGREANPKIIGYFKSVDRPEVMSDEVAWCGAFAGRALEEGGIPIDAIPVAQRLLANSYLQIGTPIDAPRPGAICVLSRGSDVSQGHVGFVVGWTETDIVLLGGNQANSVSTAHFPRARIRGLRWPETVTAKDLDKTGSRIAVAAKRNQSDVVKGSVLEGLKHAVEAAPQPAGGDMASLEGLAAGFGQFLAHKWPWLLGALQVYIALGILYRSGLIRGFRAEDASTGKTQTGGAA